LKRRRDRGVREIIRKFKQRAKSKSKHQKTKNRTERRERRINVMIKNEKQVVLK
jgi:hypothetical protein